MKLSSTHRRIPVAQAIRTTNGAGMKGEEAIGYPRPLGITRT